MKIGNWVKLNKPGRKWHLVESVIAGDAITKCGRRFPDPDFSTSAVMVLTRLIGQPQNCRYCDRGDPLSVLEATAAEDDASTAPTEMTDVP